MKLIKKIEIFLLSFIMIFSAFSMQIFAVDVSQNAEIISLIIPTEVYQGDNISIKFKFKVDLTGTTLQDGDVFSFDTNLGELFSADWNYTSLDLKNGENQVVATVDIQATKITVTFSENIDNESYFEGDVITGDWFKALDKDATEESPVTAKLFIQSSTNKIEKSIKFKKKPTTPIDPETPKKDEPCINNDFITKTTSSIANGRGAEIKLNVNRVGNLSLFKKVYDEENIYHGVQWIPNYEVIDKMIVEDKIPENGYIVPSSVKFIAVRSGIKTTQTPHDNNQFLNPQGFPLGELYPTESNSMWDVVPNNLKPKELIQNENESYDDFKQRIIDKDFSYGIYTSENNGDIFIGNLGSNGSNGKLKYSQIRSIVGYERYLDDNGPSNGIVQNYHVVFDTLYPDIEGEKTITNQGSFKMGSSALEKNHSTSYKIDNGSGNIFGKIGELKVKVVDERDTSIVISGAKFKLQKKENGEYKDVLVNNNVLEATSDINGELSFTKLGNGEYKVVQTSTISHYSFNNNTYGPASDVVETNTSITGEFEMSSSLSQGFSTIVTNAREAVGYKVEHYKQNLDLSSYTLDQTDANQGIFGDEALIDFMNYEGFNLDNNKTTYETSAKEASSTVLSIDSDGSLLIKVYYDRMNYLVEFDNNGHGQVNPDNQTVSFNDTVTKPMNPKDENYIFKGWFKEKECKTEWDFDQNTVKQNMTLYALWEIKKEEPTDPKEPVKPVIPTEPQTPDVPKNPGDDGDVLGDGLENNDSKKETDKKASPNIKNTVETSDNSSIILYSFLIISTVIVFICSFKKKED